MGDCCALLNIVFHTQYYTAQPSEFIEQPNMNKLSASISKVAIDFYYICY